MFVTELRCLQIFLPFLLVGVYPPLDLTQVTRVLLASPFVTSCSVLLFPALVMGSALPRWVDGL